MAIIKQGRINGLPEELGDGIYAFDKGKWINKSEFSINGETREFICVYESSRGVLLSVILGESISMNETGTSFVIHGWRIRLTQEKPFDLSTLLDPKIADNYEFKTSNIIPLSSFIETAYMVREMQKFYNKCTYGGSSKVRK